MRVNFALGDVIHHTRETFVAQLREPLPQQLPREQITQLVADALALADDELIAVFQMLPMSVEFIGKRRESLLFARNGFENGRTPQRALRRLRSLRKARCGVRPFSKPLRAKSKDSRRLPMNSTDIGNI